MLKNAHTKLYLQTKIRIFVFINQYVFSYTKQF